jgi:ankyrin repeat protein
MQTGAGVNQASNAGDTPLIIATLTSTSETDQIGLVGRLFEAGADEDRQDKNGNTTLHYAASWGRKDSMSLLIEAGAALDIEKNKGEMVLDAVKDEEIAALLRE